MLEFFSVSNYKNFKDEISVNFSDVANYEYNRNCIINNKYIGKMIIYGRNATGKTNLGNAITDIRFMLFRNFPFISYENVLNADSDNNVLTFKYVFVFDDDKIEYQYTKSSQWNILTETLKINKNIVFSVDLTNEKFIEIDKSFLNIDDIAEKKYLSILHNEYIDDEIQEPNIPFIRWLISNVGVPADSSILKLKKYVSQMIFLTAPNSVNPMRFSRGSRFFEWLYLQEENLKHFERFLNEMGIECKLSIEQLPDNQYELYFIRESRKISFRRTASSGTFALMELYRAIIWRNSSLFDTSFLYLDEFDAFYHYEMAERVIKYFKEFMPNCQIVLTTHNTNLMSNEYMRPDCLFILSRQGVLTPLMRATNRELKEGHNLEKMYISGEFSEHE